MIQVYAPSNTNFNMNGEVLHPERCEASFILNGVWNIELECSFNPSIVTNAILSVPTPYGRKQLYRLTNVERDDDYSYAIGFPIFLDSKNDCFLYDVRPTNKNGQEALDIMLNDTKYSAISNITNVATSYFINKNFIEALNGNDENSFINRWGGEIAYNNYQIIVNDRLGADNGLRAEFGFNLQGIKEYADMSNVVTSIVPIAYNGRMLPDRETVDSPLINKYAIAYIKPYKYEDIRLIDDIDENEDVTDITVCNTLEELYVALRERASLEFDSDIDKPSISYDVSMVDLSKTDLYTGYTQLLTVNLGDTVHCKHRRLNIETSARVIEMTYDCILEEVIDLKLGDYVYSYFDNLTDNSIVIDKVVNKENNTIIGEKVAGLINLFQTKLSAQRNAAQKQEVRAILFEDLDPNSPTYGATCYGTAGLEFSNKRNETNTEWVWENAFGPHGLIANAIVTGLLSDRLGNFYLDMDTGELRMKNGTFTGKIEGSKFIVTKERSVVITDEDIAALDNYIAYGDEYPLTKEQLSKYDINRDGKITAIDVILCEKIHMGELSGEFIDTITIYNDDTCRIKLSTTNGERTYETELTTGSIKTDEFNSSNADIEFINTRELQLNNGGLWLYGELDEDESIKCYNLGTTFPFFINSIPIKDPTVLASPGWYMNESQTVTLSEAITDQMNGVVLVWSAYEDGQSVNRSWFSHFISKHWIYSHEGQGISTGLMVDNEGTYAGAKYIYVSDKSIKGHAYNSADAFTGANSIKYTNKHWVLRYVIGV